MPPNIQCPVCGRNFRYKARKKFCSVKCKNAHHTKLRAENLQNLENQLQKPQENTPPQKIEPKIDNAEVQKLRKENSELKKELDNKNSEIQKYRDKQKEKIKKLEAQIEKLRLELKKQKAPPANLKGRLIIFKCYLELVKRIEYRFKNDNRIDKNKHEIISFKETRLDKFKNTIEHANIEQIFYSYYEYEGKGDEVSKKIKDRLRLLEEFTRNLFGWDYEENGKVVNKYSRLELYECIKDCGIETYAKNDAGLFGKYYDLPKNS